MAEKYIYWISTTLLCLLYLVSATLYIVKGDWARKAQADLGYPGYLVPTLIVVKFLVVGAILSRFNVALSDLAYAGAFYHLLLSALAHMGVGKPRGALPAFVCLALLIVSFFTQNVARETPSPYGLLAMGLHVTHN